MKFITIIIGILFIFSCAQEGDGDGFLSDYNKCVWTEESEGYVSALDAALATDVDSWQELHSASSDKFLSQSFQLTESRHLYGISLYLKTTSSLPTSGIKVQIMTNDESTDAPSVVEGESKTVKITAVDTTGKWYKFPFSSVPFLNENVRYWIKLDPQYDSSATRHYLWGYEGSNPAEIFQKSSNETTWTSISGLSVFRFMACRD